MTLVLNCSRTSGPAPLGVVFDAVGTTWSGVARPFEELAYRWDFGYSSPAAVAWEPVTAHVFKTPGTYTVTLYVTKDGSIIETAMVEITVQDPEVVYAGTNTVCFSNDTDFTGKPAGAAEVTTALFADVISNLANGKRALLKRGDTFSQTVASTPGWLAATDCQIGAFGTPGGAADAFGSYDDDPLIDLEAGTGNWPCTLTCNNSHRLAVYNLRLRMENVGDAPAFIGRGYQSENEHLTFTSIRVIQGTGGENPHTVFTFPADGDKLHEGVVVDRVNCQSLKAYGFYGGVYKCGILNCYFDDIEYQHHVRFPHVRRGVVMLNHFRASAAGTHNIKLCAPTWNGTDYSEYVVITENFLEPNGASYSMQLSSENASTDQRPRHVIVSKNDWKPRAYLFIACYCHGYDYEFRFNRIYEAAGVTGSNYMTFLCLIAKEPASKPESYGFRFIGNCVYGLRTHASGNGYLCQDTAGYDGTIYFYNNVCYNPNETSTYGLYNDNKAEAIVAEGNRVSKTVDPLWTDPANQDWTIPTGSPCKDAGAAAPYYLDAAGKQQPAGAGWDQGAFEFGAEDPEWDPEPEPGGVTGAMRLALLGRRRRNRWICGPGRRGRR